DLPRGQVAQETGVAHVHGTLAHDGADHAGDPRRLPRAAQGHPRPVEVQAAQRRGELVEVALASLLAVAHDVAAGPLHVAHGQPDGVVLRLPAERVGDAPDLRRAQAGDAARHERRGVHEPARLRIAADDGRHEPRPVGRRAPQKTARGFAGEPVPPTTLRGAMTSMNSFRASWTPARASGSSTALSRRAAHYAKTAACTPHVRPYPMGMWWGIAQAS